MDPVHELDFLCLLRCWRSRSGTGARLRVGIGVTITCLVALWFNWTLAYLAPIFALPMLQGRAMPTSRAVVGLLFATFVIFLASLLVGGVARNLPDTVPAHALCRAVPQLPRSRARRPRRHPGADPVRPDADADDRKDLLGSVVGSRRVLLLEHRPLADGHRRNVRGVAATAHRTRAVAEGAAVAGGVQTGAQC